MPKKGSKITADVICTELAPLPSPLSLSLPGGITIERINLLEVIDPLLAPLMPVFRIVDVIAAIINCIQAIPEAIVEPTAITDCLKELSQKLAHLLKMIPQLSVPYMLIGLIDMLIAELRRVRGAILHLQRQMAAINRAIDRAKELNDPQLNAIAICAQTNLHQEAMNTTQMLGSLGRLIGIINLFSKMIGGPEIPDFQKIADAPFDLIIEPIDAVLDVLRVVRKAVPLP